MTPTLFNLFPKISAFYMKFNNSINFELSLISVDHILQSYNYWNKLDGNYFLRKKIIS